MLTSATLPGTVQLTPAGKLIILMRDGQTTGGYPRVLQLDTKSIALLSQKKFGDKVSLHPLRH
jgi:allophanate hydrolase subunit 2